MSKEFDFDDLLAVLVDNMVENYKSDERTHHLDCQYLPNRAEIVEIAERLLELAYPGYIGRQHLTSHNVPYHVGELLQVLGEMVYHQIYNCLCYQSEVVQRGADGERGCDGEARRITHEYFRRIPKIRDLLASDVQAAYDGDPAASDTAETILAYPGVFAVSVYRLAHELYGLGVPIMPRIMTEWAHRMTGVDIHPGAQIGRNFFIDHGTGVVIGETTVIGNNVKIYQGVTLGALSFPKDERGRLIRGYKRHPTVEDDVTIYANAIVLGGETVLGKGSVVGGSVFLTSSIPPGSTVTFKPPELRVRDRQSQTAAPHIRSTAEPVLDYQI